MAAENEYPFELKDVPSEEQGEVHKCLTGPSGYYLPNGFKVNCSKIYNMDVRPSDVFVVTFPKSGTTWTQELVWLIGNDLDYETAVKLSLKERFPFIEFNFFFYNSNAEDQEKKEVDMFPLHEKFVDTLPNIDAIFNAPSPRFIKSHLPFSLLPPTLLDTAKVVYVARDPRDAAVSYYHHCKMMKMYGLQGNFKEFWNLFISNRVDWSPYDAHIKEAWEKRHHPNMLFLFYEELYKDLPAAVRRVSQFLNKTVTEEQILKLCDHLHIDNFRNNKSVNLDELEKIGYTKNGHFIRKGKAGGWRSHFDEEMTQQAERWMKEKLGDVGIQFPNVN